MQEKTTSAEKTKAFPFLEGKVFNIFDVEQGLKQINRLGFSQARSTSFFQPKNFKNLYFQKRKNMFLN